MEAMYWTWSGAAFVVVWAVIIAIVSHYRARHRLRESEMLHRERMQALEKGVPFADLPSGGPVPVATAWVRTLLPALARILGFAATFVGLGLCVAFRIAPDEGFHGLWTMGLIPGMAGIGLLLYGYLDRYGASAPGATE